MLSLWMKSSISNFPVYIYVDGWGGEIKDWYELQVFGVTDKWKCYTLNFNVPKVNGKDFSKEIKTMVMRLVIRSVEGNLWMDDVVLKLKEK